MQPFGNFFSIPFPEQRLLIVWDEKNPEAMLIAESLEPLKHRQPNLIVVIGGDGFMLRNIRRFWNKGLPFFGINSGHRGFLLNERSVIENGFPKEISIHTLPLLEGEIVTDSGKTKRFLAFNDVWVERAQSQTAWIEVKVNGVVQLPKLIADGVLLSTPAGSSAYARAMGTSPLPLDAQALVLSGSNVSSPNFKPCYLPIDSSLEFRTLDPLKRPLFGVVDGIRQGKVRTMRANVSKTASVQLAFEGKHSLSEKLVDIQFQK